jgi:ABC-type Fe3+-hydroxamate transport system substrate-binding protein
LIKKLTSTAFLQKQIPVEVFSFDAFQYIWRMILNAISQAELPAKRIISLVPSQSELLHYLGLEHETIGITKFCIHPNEWYRSKIRVGGTKDVDVQKVISLQPDLVIANKEENVKEQVEELARLFPVWMTDVNTLDDALMMISDIGSLTGTEKLAAELVSRVSSLFNALDKSGGVRVCYLIWKAPYMVAASGTFIDDMISRAGFRNVFRNRERYPVVTIDDIRRADPQVILLSSEPYPFNKKHLQEITDELPGIPSLLVDGEMFSWYGSRLLYVPAYFRELRADVSSLITTSRQNGK